MRFGRERVACVRVCVCVSAGSTLCRACVKTVARSLCLGISEPPAASPAREGEGEIYDSWGAGEQREERLFLFFSLIRVAGPRLG